MPCILLVRRGRRFGRRGLDDTRSFTFFGTTVVWGVGLGWAFGGWGSGGGVAFVETVVVEEVVCISVCVETYRIDALPKVRKTGWGKEFGGGGSTQVSCSESFIAAFSRKRSALMSCHVHSCRNTRIYTHQPLSPHKTQGTSCASGRSGCLGCPGRCGEYLCEDVEFSPGRRVLFVAEGICLWFPFEILFSCELV